jgi:fructuronate reductase
MQLNEENLLSLKSTDIEIPAFDRAKLIERTKLAPAWLHFGAGNIFRAYLARACQDLIEAGGYDRGIIAAEGYDYELIDMVFTPHDSLFILVTLKADGSVTKKAVASITEALKASSKHDDFERLKEIFRADSLQMVSFTITEKGYSLQNPAKETSPDVLYDFENGVETPRSYMGRIAALVYERYVNGCKPLSLVSMDNCSHNGDKLKAAVGAFATEWEQRGLVEKGFVDYINNPQKVAFPWSMIDKITPVPHKDVRKMLEGDGLTGMVTIVTSKNSYAAPFVNTEEAEYLVIEDAFPNSRPPLEKSLAGTGSGGIIFTDRETVDKTEKMKVCTCLNPLHTALAIFGCLLGFTKISEVMKDADLHRLAEKIGYNEGLPSVVDPVIISPRAFLDEVLNLRLPNPFLPDTPQRIVTDTSQKLSVRFGETVKAYMQRADLDINNLKLIPLVFAGWLRYLMGVDDNGHSMELSPDPLHLTLNSHIKHVKLNPDDPVNTEELTQAPISYRERVRPILEDPRIFGVNLYDAELGEKVEDMFGELIEGAGAVRRTLQKYLEA